MKRHELKALLIQIRENQTVKSEELNSFANFSNLSPEQFIVWDVFEKPDYSHLNLSSFDLIFVGGASEASVSEPERFPFVAEIKNAMLETIEKSIPVFASCFGFQAAVLALGGKIIKDSQNYEMGTYPISLTARAARDPIYQGIPNNFQAISVHQEKALKLPANCELLGFTDSCCHSFKVKNKPFWAFQFHPELDKATLTQRLNIYKENYTEDINHFEKVISSLKEVSYSNQLVTNFSDHILREINR